MSTETVPGESLLGSADRETSDWAEAGKMVRTLLGPLASLKLTVVLFALAILLILFGTLAQHRKDIWEVVEQYFRVPLWPTLGFAWVEFQDLLPTSFFGSLQVRGGVFFPGGTLIGGLMAVNLLAAHGLRFKAQASGSRLWGGLGVIGLGVLVTAAVILSGSNKEGVHESIWGDWSTLWLMMKVGLGVAFLASLAGYAWMIARTKSAWWVLTLAGLAPAILGALFFYTVIGGASVQLDGPSMRILWQLMKGTAAGLVLLAGCAMVFKKRAGVVLLHGGIGLMMFSEVQVATTAVESQMPIDEGQLVNFAQDIRSVELAVVKRGGEGPVTNTVVPGTMLKSAAGSERLIQHPDLPFDLKVLDYLPNSSLRDVTAAESNRATEGAGLNSVAEAVKPGTGTDSDSAVDIASVYVQLLNPADEKPIGTWLVSQYLNPQPVTVGGETCDVVLRFKRIYKPYTVKLLDVQKRDYLGTSTPRDYSSYIRLHDPTRNVDRKIRVWMNNPLRFAGETFYQSNYHKRMVTQLDPASGQRRPVLVTDPATGERTPKFVESTTLSVVTNQGWMIPYVSCMIVATGLLAHFLQVLVRFLNRQQRETRAAEPIFDDQGDLQPTGWAEPSAPPPHGRAARKLAKKARARRVEQPDLAGGSLLDGESGLVNWLVPLAVVLVCAMYIGSKARTPKPAADGMDLYAFGKIPVVYQGRQKPLDTLARNALRVISDRQTFKGRMTDDQLKKNWGEITVAVQEKWPRLSEADLKGADGDVDKLTELIEKQTSDDPEQVGLFVDKQVNVKQSAIRWLLDVIARPDRAAAHKVFRIENLEVLDTLGLPRRSGYRYALDEFFDKGSELEKQARLARSVRQSAPENLSTYQRKILELDVRLHTFMLLVNSFRLPQLPPLPNAEKLRDNPEAQRQAFQSFSNAYAAARADQERLMQDAPPLLVPVPEEMRQDEKIFAGWGKEREEWETYASAWLNDFSRQRIFGKAANTATLAVQEVFVAYTVGDAGEFNKSVAEYQKLLSTADDLPVKDLEKNRFEAFFNHFAPFFYAIWLYFFAFVLGCIALLLAGLRSDIWHALRNGATWLVAGTFLLHTFALISRIYISGRPPVTNLYSSAIFIGWGAVVLGLVIESIFPIAIGTIVAAVSGFATMWIAHLLSGDGDTFTVLQAVLDTQFWLATHVTSITLGYATTFFAGLMGFFYVVLGFATPLFSQRVGADLGKILGKVIYGILCFAILFSFVGTVLGGLWADDSWGRFWGWDPKENGALIIVLWNALVLHARWDGMVKERGLAVLAIGGNIVTAWSWFGVNELGVGLHSYGFTEGVLLALGAFVVSQLLIIGVGCLPKELWWSFRRRGSNPVA